MPNHLSGHDALIGMQRDLPRSNFEVDLSRSLSAILFLMTSGDLNIDLTQRSYIQKLQVFQRPIKRRLPFVFPIRGFRDLTGARKSPSRFRTGAHPQYC